MSSTTGVNGPRAHAWPWTALTRLAPVLLTVVVAVALLGAVVTPPVTMLLVAPALGIVFATHAALAQAAFPGGSSVRRTALLAGVGGTLLVPFAAGIGFLGTVGGMVVLALVAMAGGAALGWMARRPAEHDGPATGEADPAGLHERIRDLPTRTLLTQWRWAGTQLRSGTDPERRMALVRLRALVLDELSRRDPAGVERWLENGGRDDLDRHITADPTPDV
ncbi:MAG TPA: hypothetical protein VHF92_13400 [Geodermatophilus sp.]|nr:hypothetical protein [Geodermatophilus sp.]